MSANYLQFLFSLNSNRRSIVHKLRLSIAPTIFKQNAINYCLGTDHSLIPSFVGAVYHPGSKKFSKFAPILFPGGVYDIKHLFKCQHLALVSASCHLLADEITETLSDASGHPVWCFVFKIKR